MNQDKSGADKGNRNSPNSPASGKSEKNPARAAKSDSAKAPAAPVVPAKLPPLFRALDWITFGSTFLFIFIGYMITLSPDLTLQDSGELATGSFYAGVPHPPGYPVWTLWTHFFTVILPFKNIAWRVSVASAVSASLACGLLALLVSRGSSMMMEGIVSLKTIDRKIESAICVVSGFVAGLLMGYNGLMWSQAVIVEVYPFSVLSLMGVLCFLMRWIYAPNERRWLYFAMFLFGICITNHQSLLIAAIGIEVAITAAQPKLGRDLFLGNAVIYIGILILKGKGAIATPLDNNPPLLTFFHSIGVGSIVACGFLIFKTEKLLTEWKATLIMLGCWVAGAAFYLYMAIGSMTNPPMNWGYARTADGFMHALKRGQYEAIHPTTSVLRFFQQLFDLYGGGVLEQFNLLCVVIAMVPFIFYRFMQKREKAWIVGVTGIFFCLSFLLLILLNPGLTRQDKELHKVFFEGSHVMIAMMVGYGLTLIAAFLATQYEAIRRWALMGASIGVAVGLYTLASAIGDIFGDRTESTGLGLFFFGLGKVFNEGQNKLQIYPEIFLLVLTVVFLILILVWRKQVRIGIVLGLFSLLPLWSIIGHWYDNEQRGHLFGYWFGHDMFTPPFVGTDGKLTYDAALRQQLLKKPEGKMIYPEMTRDAVLYGGTDPGRFCPTYMIFCESFIPPRCKPRDPVFDRRDVYIITQNALADNTYLNYIRAHYNRSTQKDPPFFTEFFHMPFLKPLDNLFEGIGAKVEARRRAEGVYPPAEIKTASPEDSQRAFNVYLTDAGERARRNQLRPGEDFKEDNGKISVSGQVAVMAINGLLTKTIFDANPTNEFFVEESFPLDWMFPHLTPFGVIMKINRQPLPELTQDICDLDHNFWSKYSDRFVGNWITYDTPVSNVCAFAEKLYLHRDFKNFHGDPAFIRDNDAQKAFSKLRSSIGGIYAWRLGVLTGIDTPPQYRVKTPEEHARMVREADFAFKQSFAFCPYSPEAVYRYMQLLLATGRLDDAISIVHTCNKLDPANTPIKGLLDQLREMRKKSPGAATPAPADLQKLVRDGMTLLQQKRTNEGVALLDQAMSDPRADGNVIMFAAQRYLEMNDFGRLEQALLHLVQVVPDQPDAWYDLAGLESNLGKTQQAAQALIKSMQLSAQRLKADPKARNLWETATNDPRFTNYREMPEFKALRPTK